MDNSLDMLKERAKELECLYKIDEALSENDLCLEEVFLRICRIIPIGFRYDDKCVARIVFQIKAYAVSPFPEPYKSISAPIKIYNIKRGEVEVAYPDGMQFEGEEAFLEQEVRLIQKIANRIVHYIYMQKVNSLRRKHSEWKVILDLIQKTDAEMLRYICRKMIAHMAIYANVNLESVYTQLGWDIERVTGEKNYPIDSLQNPDIIKLSNELFAVAIQSMSDTEITELLGRWIHQERAYALIKSADHKDTSVAQLSYSIKKYIETFPSEKPIYPPTERWLTVELIRRFLTSNERTIQKILPYISLKSLSGLLDRIICSPHNARCIGGKGAGLFIAWQMICGEAEKNPLLANVKIPQTWYISTDEIDEVLHLNNLEELNEFKYKELFEVRIGYPNLVQTMKNAVLPFSVTQGLSSLLDECGDAPLIVRSSSLLEDQMGTAFSGKYKSLFIANQGEKKKKIECLSKAILEVYASSYNPDSIQYRKQHNLQDHKEQMGIVIQEVVGTRVGPYFFPAYSGVAMSNNEFRWSSRIKQQDGLIRMVAGLGTRAVDRVGDDFPMLISPGQPNLRVNQSIEDIRYYSQKNMDVLNLETESFDTICIEDLLREYGAEMHDLSDLISIDHSDYLGDPLPFDVNPKKDKMLVTFNGFLKKSAFMDQIKTILQLLGQKLEMPVDIEFAGDGKNLYLLQCRPQSLSKESSPAAIPADIQEKDVLFSAHRYITNGSALNISHIVYVDPERYALLQSREAIKDVSVVIGKLNTVLPKRKFILMGPGRWGSRGDMKLGVPVTYSDINNTAMLIEIALKKSGYVPELSFGTHFFQDMVEANIKYMPLYPNEGQAVFNKYFFDNSENMLSQIFPEFSRLSEVVKVVDIANEAQGKTLNILMNGDLEKAVAYIGDYVSQQSIAESLNVWKPAEQEGDQYWHWRHYMAERIAERMDMNAMGVKAIYLFGSTNNCSAGINSDVDLIIHTDGDSVARAALIHWLEGWSLCLSEYNYLRTGYTSNGLLDVHLVTDRDIAEKQLFASMISSVYEPIQLLRKREEHK